MTRTYSSAPGTNDTRVVSHQPPANPGMSFTSVKQPAMRLRGGCCCPCPGGGIWICDLRCYVDDDYQQGQEDTRTIASPTSQHPFPLQDQRKSSSATTREPVTSKGSEGTPSVQDGGAPLAQLEAPPSNAKREVAKTLPLAPNIVYPDLLQGSRQSGSGRAQSLSERPCTGRE